jgi:HD superfamily phosphohydrolase
MFTFTAPPLQAIHRLAEPERKCEVKEKLLQDDVWGQISVTKMTLQFIDTPVFQRLRNLHQLGGAKWVYPSATHTRFEHSIGM